MAVMLDTSAVIALVERKHVGIRRLLDVHGVLPNVSVMTIGELEHGVEAATDHVQRRRRAWTLQACDRMEVSNIDRATARLYGRLSLELPRRVGSADRWIAAGAAVLGATLVTFDRPLAEALADRRKSADHIEIATILLNG